MFSLKCESSGPLCLEMFRKKTPIEVGLCVHLLKKNHFAMLNVGGQYETVSQLFGTFKYFCQHPA